MMTEALLVGGLAGLALFLAVVALIPRRVSLAARVAAFDASQVTPLTERAVTDQGSESALTRKLGTALERFCAEQGWQFPSLRANLRLTGKSFESYLGTKALLALFGLLVPLFLLSGLSLIGLHLSIIVPVWVALIFAFVFFFLPDLELKQEVDRRRRDFRHAIGAFLDLVAMNLAGGRGVPEALMSASEIGEGWAFWRIKEALTNARITGQTPWQALGQLGVEVRVDELRDLAGALSLVAEDGAKVRESLTARAVSLRRKELADLEGQAAERSQSMLVAQLVMAGAFLVFLIYPAVQVLLNS
ncbi:MAG TPA: type II secretion system F family protein [Trebonia sp.]